MSLNSLKSEKYHEVFIKSATGAFCGGPWATAHLIQCLVQPWLRI